MPASLVSVCRGAQNALGQMPLYVTNLVQATRPDTKGNSRCIKVFALFEWIALDDKRRVKQPQVVVRNALGGAMALVRSILLVDGENLTMRYQAMLAEGRVPKAGVKHSRDVYVWQSSLGGTAIINTDLIRINYYTSVVADDDGVNRFRSEIGEFTYHVDGDFYGICQLLPRVYKKPKKSTKSRLVDINITIDAMRHAYSNAVDVIYLFSGDGDFVHLVEEIARSGRKVCLAAFSSGLEPRLVSSVDRFTLLDDFYFEAVAPQVSPANLACNGAA